MASRIAMTVIAPLFFYYTISIVWTSKEVFFKWIRFTAWIYVAFALMIASSPFTGIIYKVSDDYEVISGPLYSLMYAVPAVYIVIVFVNLIFARHRLSRSLSLVILSFPVLCLIFVTVEYYYPHILISSTAATASLVISYLYIQNKKILEDDLTGTMNRRAFAKVVSMRLEDGSPRKIVLVSLIEFKTINNQYGERIGDRVLQAVAYYLMNLRPDAQVFRLSGDEFALLTSVNENQGLVETIGERMFRHWAIEGIKLTVSATIAELDIPEVTDTLEDTVHVLEYCIREQKSLHKSSRITINNEALERMRRKNKVYEYLKLIIRKRELDVVYQPIYHADTDSYPVFEALARLTSPELGPISPPEFIAIAEEKGLIGRLGEVLLEQVCRTIKRLESEGIAFQHININISPIQMMNDNMVGEVEHVLLQQRIDPSRIHLEITESVVIDNFDKINDVMNGFNRRGIQFSLDDYGTGYSNLSNIIHLPFKGIKIDKSLLYRASDCQSTFVIIQALSRSLQQIGKHIVIEGVETEGHIQLARAIGCDYMQGYYFAKPMTNENLIAFLQRETMRSEAR
ncbi:putative bifunctional diguanylate cyclase/phosphodiesterase [Cohnella sp. GCM10027633]|uniref:putative bifunctional diguanylate cyclase/phosphodiesterase n=1 Tax=unclassified Cohnella TaxID=2636738 RepID=UPI00363AE2DB